MFHNKLALILASFILASCNSGNVTGSTGGAAVGNGVLSIETGTTGGDSQNVFSMTSNSVAEAQDVVRSKDVDPKLVRSDSKSVIFFQEKSFGSSGYLIKVVDVKFIAPKVEVQYTVEGPKSGDFFQPRLSIPWCIINTSVENIIEVELKKI